MTEKKLAWFSLIDGFILMIASEALLILTFSGIWLIFIYVGLAIAIIGTMAASQKES